MPGRIGSEALRWGPPVAWMALIFLLSAQPNLRLSDDGGLDFVVRKFGHVGAYATLAALFLRALGRPDRRTVAAALLVTLVYAGGDELHQGFVTGRSAAAFDVAVDAAGAVAGILLWLRLGPRLRAAAARVARA